MQVPERVHGGLLLRAGSSTLRLTGSGSTEMRERCRAGIWHRTSFFSRRSMMCRFSTAFSSCLFLAPLQQSRNALGRCIRSCYSCDRQCV